MKANELMIGDWVTLNGVDYKWQWTHHDFTASEFSTLEPIPLIPEILEKNGFVKGYNRWDKEETFDDVVYPYKIHLEDEGHFLYVEIKTYDAFYQGKVRDVQELQHALRFCGLNELADNLII